MAKIRKKCLITKNVNLGLCARSKAHVTYLCVCVKKAFAMQIALVFMVSVL